MSLGVSKTSFHFARTLTKPIENHHYNIQCLPFVAVPNQTESVN